MFIVNWWNSLEIAGQIFCCIAIPSTLILLIQTIMMFLGIGDDGIDGGDIPDGDIDMDVDNPDGVFGGSADEPDDISGMEGLKIFTFRGIIAFLVVFGWVGLAMSSAEIPLYITLPVAIVCGALMLIFVAALIRAALKLRNDGNIDNRNAIGVSGKVQLTIPAKRGGDGKVHLMLQGSYVERDAVTDDESPIPTGAEVVVIGISGQTTLVVKRK